MKSKIALILAACLALAGFTGCVNAGLDYEKDAQLQAGQPPEYAQGYADGYASGYADNGNMYYTVHKDVNRYLSDPKYKLGWDDGYRKTRWN